MSKSSQDLTMVEGREPVRDQADEVSAYPRAADVQQLHSAYAIHRSECLLCRADASCDLARRMERARNAVEAEPS